MDVLGATTTVVSVIETAWKVINYIKDVKGAGEARQKLILELVRATGLLSTLKDIVKDVENKEWSRALQSLEGFNGPLNDFKAILQKIVDETGMRSDSTRVIPIRAPDAAAPKPVRSKMMNKIDHVVKDLKWHFAESTIQGLLIKLERIKTHFLLALSSDNVRLSKLIQTELQIVHSEIFAVRDNTVAILEHQRGASESTNEQKLIFQSISTLDSSLSISPERLEQLKQGAHWLLNHSDFRHWHTSNSKSMLLLKGAGGTGKTSISRVVEHFLRASGTSSEIFVVGIYLSYLNRPREQTLQAMLALIVAHMFEIRPQFQKYYKKLMLTGEDPLSIEDSLRIIHRARQDFQHFYIVLDGLDECTEQLAHELIERLAQLHSPLAMFVTMRPISQATKFSNVVEVLISEKLISGHIRLYVRSILREDPPANFDLSDETDVSELDRITDTIVARSQGVILLATLLLQWVRNASTKVERRPHLLAERLAGCLSEPPDESPDERFASTIHATYMRTLQDLIDQEAADATLGKRVLKEVLFADHPMSTEELLDAVAADAKWDTGDRGHVAERIERCVKCCIAFICCAEDGSVQIVHPTAEEFLRGPYGAPVWRQA